MLLLLYFIISGTYYTSNIFTGDPNQSFQNLKQIVDTDLSGEIIIIDDYEPASVWMLQNWPGTNILIFIAMQPTSDIHFSSALYVSGIFKWYQVSPRQLQITHESYYVAEGLFVAKHGVTTEFIFRDLNVSGPWLPPTNNKHAAFIKVVNGNGTGLWNGLLSVTGCKIKGFSLPIVVSAGGTDSTTVEVRNCELEGEANISAWGDNGIYLDIYNNKLHQKNRTPGHNHNLYIHPWINAKVYYNHFSFEGDPSRYVIAFNGGNHDKPPAHYVQVVGNTFDETIPGPGVLAPRFSEFLYEGNISKVGSEHVQVQGQNIIIRNNRFENGKKIMKTEGMISDDFDALYENNVAINVPWFGDLYGGRWEMNNNYFESFSTQPRQEYMLVAFSTTLTSVGDTVRLHWLGSGGKSIRNTNGIPVVLEDMTFYNKAQGGETFLGPFTFIDVRLYGPNGFIHY